MMGLTSRTPERQFPGFEFLIEFMAGRGGKTPIHWDLGSSIVLTSIWKMDGMIVTLRFHAFLTGPFIAAPPPPKLCQDLF